MSFPIPCRLQYIASMSDCNLPIRSCRSSVWSRQSALPDLSGKYPVPFLQASFLNFSISTTYFLFLDELTIQWEKYYRIVSTVSDRTELDRIWAEIRKLPYVLSDTPENFVAELEGIRAETKLIYKRQTILR